MCIPKNISSRNLLFLLAAASACLLAFALMAQYGFNLHPCHLCLLQRYPYAAIALLGFTGAFFAPPRVQFLIAGVCCALFFVDAGIAFYHAGVELHIFPGPTSCTNTSGAGQTLEEMRAAIMNAPLVACDQAMASFLGLSMAAWNGIAASILTIFTAAALVSIRRKNHA
jgi:disulfide bond formation protein DsbB